MWRREKKEKNTYEIWMEIRWEGPMGKWRGQWVLDMIKIHVAISKAERSKRSENTLTPAQATCHTDYMVIFMDSACTGGKDVTQG